MVKEALSEAGLAPLAVIGLMLFVTVFVSIAVWAMTRSRGTVSRWSSLPLADGYNPVEPRYAEDSASRNDSLSIVSQPEQKSGGCGKCENCTC